MKLRGFPECIDIGEKRNELAKRARGEYLVHFDDDDFYGANYLDDRIGNIKAHLKRTGLTPADPFIVKGLRWLEWDLTTSRQADGTTGVLPHMCILDIQRPLGCEQPDPGYDGEYGHSCGVQDGHDWGFTWVYTRATVFDREDNQICPFFHTSIGEEEAVIRCLKNIDLEAGRSRADQVSIASIVSPNFNLMKIDAGGSVTTTYRPCENIFDRKNIIRHFQMVEDVDTVLFRKPGTACYILNNHVLAKDQGRPKPKLSPSLSSKLLGGHESAIPAFLGA
jgi:hypothetical protein